MKKAARPQDAHVFEQIPNVGPRMAEDLRRLGLVDPQELRGRNPYALYVDLCRTTGTTLDPCVIDVFISATRFMSGEPARPWWTYTEERKAAVRRQPRLVTTPSRRAAKSKT